tara:strand:+ start:353 stop:766 length:414 start_codon:yes stop_codon:yes gene_type:complete
MTQTESERKAKELEKAINKLRKDGLIVDVVGQYGIQTMLTADGFKQHELLTLFIPNNETVSTENKKPKKSGQEKMDGAIKTIVQVGAGISQLMEGLGKLAGDPVKMDMSQAGIDIGQNKKKYKKQTHKKGKPRRKKR